LGAIVVGKAVFGIGGFFDGMGGVFSLMSSLSLLPVEPEEQVEAEAVEEFCLKVAKSDSWN